MIAVSQNSRLGTVLNLCQGRTQQGWRCGRAAGDADEWRCGEEQQDREQRRDDKQGCGLEELPGARGDGGVGAAGRGGVAVALVYGLRLGAGVRRLAEEVIVREDGGKDGGGGQDGGSEEHGPLAITAADVAAGERDERRDGSESDDRYDDDPQVEREGVDRGVGYVQEGRGWHFLWVPTGLRREYSSRPRGRDGAGWAGRIARSPLRT